MLLSEAVGKDERKSPTKGNSALLLRAKNFLLSSETEGSLFPIPISSTAFTLILSSLFSPIWTLRDFHPSTSHRRLSTLKVNRFPDSI